MSGLKSWVRGKTLSITLFVYAAVAGTALPVALSRCTASCTTCGACGTVFLGILPLIFGVMLRDRLKRVFYSGQPERELERNRKC